MRLTPEARLAEPFGNALRAWSSMHAKRAPARRAVVEGERHIDWSGARRGREPRRGAAAAGGPRAAWRSSPSARRHRSSTWWSSWAPCARASTVAPISPALTPESIDAMVADCGARRMYRGEPLDEWLRAARRCPQARGCRARRMPSTSSIRPARPERPKGIAQPNADALGAHAARPAFGYAADSVTLISHAALLQHDAGRRVSDARHRRHARADAEVRRDRLPGARGDGTA
jgi:hypothetical protein